MDPYLRVNESALWLADEQILGDENEEYVPNWSSDWRTSEPGSRGGDYNASAPPQGSAARFGPLASFPCRYLVSTLRALQMRVSYLLASVDEVINDALYAYVALELGKRAGDAPDCWAFLISTGRSAPPPYAPPLPPHICRLQRLRLLLAADGLAPSQSSTTGVGR
jgi:hypothetical protein